VFYNNLTSASVDQVEAEARNASQKLLNDLNKQSLQLQIEDKAASGDRQRYRFGVYFYREDAEAPRKETKSDE